MLSTKVEIQLKPRLTFRHVIQDVDLQDRGQEVYSIEAYRVPTSGIEVRRPIGHYSILLVNYLA